MLGGETSRSGFQSARGNKELPYTHVTQRRAWFARKSRSKTAQVLQDDRSGDACPSHCLRLNMSGVVQRSGYHDAVQLHHKQNREYVEGRRV